MTPIQKLQARMRLAFDAGWEESKHPRAKDGKFGKGSGGASAKGSADWIAEPKAAIGQIAAKVKQKWNQTTPKQKVSAVVRAPLHAEHAVKHGIKSLAEHAYEVATGDLEAEPGTPGWHEQQAARGKFSKSLGGKVVNGVKMASSGVLKLAFLPWIAGEKAVEGIARAKGMSDEDAAKLRTLVTCYDALNCKAIALGCHAAMMPGLAAASIWFPTASMAYIAHAAAKDRPAVIKAARAGITKAKAAIGRTTKRLKDGLEFAAEETPNSGATMVSKVRQSIGLLADAIKAHSGSDMYYALLAEAMDNAEGAAEAVQLADWAFRQVGKTSLRRQE